MGLEVFTMSSPGDPGTTVGGIKTPMCDKNVDRQNTPGRETYPGTGTPSGGGGGGKIKGPGEMGKWEK